MSILVLTSDTLIGTPATGNIEYNGQFYGTDSNASRAQMQRITQGTAVASTSGTSIDFTGLPAWVKRITVMFNGVSTNGTSPVQVQLGTSGGVTTSGYAGSVTTTVNSSATNTFTTGFSFNSTVDVATFVRHGVLTIVNISGNAWAATGIIGLSDSARIIYLGGTVSLSGTLDRVRITTVNGTDTFDAGSINILYEG